MARIICSLPNASTLINGIKFVADRAEMVSEEVAEEVAAMFGKITGYRVAGVKKPAAQAATVPATEPAAASAPDKK